MHAAAVRAGGRQGDDLHRGLHVQAFGDHVGSDHRAVRRRRGRRGRVRGARQGPAGPGHRDRLLGADRETRGRLDL